MRVINACWEDISGAFAEAAKVRDALRAKHGAKLDEARRHWLVRELATRFDVEQAARRRVIFFPLIYAALLGAAAWLLQSADAAVRTGAPAQLASALSGSAVPAWLWGPGWPVLLAVSITLGLVGEVRFYDRWRKAHRRLDVRDDECPYPSGDLAPKLWDELSRRPVGLEGMRETEGSEGERVLTTLLGKALSDDYVCLLGPLVAEALDVDVLVFGPTGVWVLDSKFHRGRVDYVGGQFIKTKELGDRTVEKEFDLVREMDREVEGVQVAVAAAGLRQLVHQVRGMVVFTHPEIELHTLGSPFSCVLPKQVPGAILQGPTVRGLSLPATLAIIDALAAQAKRLATRDSDLIKASARAWVKEEAGYHEHAIVDCIRRLEEQALAAKQALGRPKNQRRGRDRYKARDREAGEPQDRPRERERQRPADRERQRPADREPRRDREPRQDRAPQRAARQAEPEAPQERRPRPAGDGRDWGRRKRR